MTDFGTDFSCTDDLDPRLSTVSGPLAVAQAVVRRLQTPRGGLWYDPNYGTDVRRFLHAPAHPRRISAAVESESRKDERVMAARATATASQGTLTIRLLLTLAEGPFELTISVDELTVELIDFSEAA